MIKCFTAGNWTEREWYKKMFVTGKLQLLDIYNTKTSKNNLNLTARRGEDIVGGHKDHKSKKQKILWINNILYLWIILWLLIGFHYWNILLFHIDRISRQHKIGNTLHNTTTQTIKTTKRFKTLDSSFFKTWIVPTLTCNIRQNEPPVQMTNTDDKFANNFCVKL